MNSLMANFCNLNIHRVGHTCAVYWLYYCDPMWQSHSRKVNIQIMSTYSTCTFFLEGVKNLAEGWNAIYWMYSTWVMQNLWQDK